MYVDNTLSISSATTVAGKPETTRSSIRGEDIRPSGRTVTDAVRSGFLQTNMFNWSPGPIR
jgi:hypothetical protein